MSIPSCIRPQRQPNPLVTGPETGQIIPPDERTTPEEDCEVWIRDESEALTAASATTSWRYSSFCCWTDTSASRRWARVPESAFSRATSSLRTCRVCSVRAATACATVKILFLVTVVFACCTVIRSFARPTDSAIRSSWAASSSA